MLKSLLYYQWQDFEEYMKYSHFDMFLIGIDKWETYVHYGVLRWWGDWAVYTDACKWLSSKALLSGGSDKKVINFEKLLSVSLTTIFVFVD